MACKVTDNGVLFLYLLKAGACPKVGPTTCVVCTSVLEFTCSVQSYGLNVAQMAGLPTEVVIKAEEKSRKFEEETPLLSGNYLCASPCSC